MQNLDFVKLQVILMLTNAYVNGLYNQSYILCTNESSWLDAMETCLLEGGRPLTHDDIKMTNLSGKIDRTVWTAEYTALSNRRWNSSTGRDLLRDTVCGSQTIYRDEMALGSIIDRATDIQYKNCTEQQAYICDGGQDQKHMHPQIYLNEATWMNAEASCKSQNRGLFTFNQRGFGIPVALELLEPMKVDVWIGFLASLDRRNRIEKGQLHNVDIVKCGTFSNSAGYRMIDEYLPNQFAALCDFESLMPVRGSLFTECVNEDVTKTLPKDISTSSEGGLSNTATGIIALAAIAVVIGCIVTVVLVLYFYRKRHTRKDANSGTGQITSLPQARVFQDIYDNTADWVCDQNQAEKEVNSEVIPENIHKVYVNDRDEVHHVELAVVNPGSSYVNKTPEAIYEVDSDYVNEKEERRYEALMQVKDSVYANKTSEGHYEELVKDNTEIVYVNE